MTIANIKIMHETTSRHPKDHYIHADLFVNGRAVSCNGYFHFDDGVLCNYKPPLYIIMQLKDLCKKKFGLAPEIRMSYVRDGRPWEVYF